MGNRKKKSRRKVTALCNTWRADPNRVRIIPSKPLPYSELSAGTAGQER